MNSCDATSLTAIVKPTYACNLGCLYCYEGGRSQPWQCMDEGTLRNVITKLAQYHDAEQETRIIWHGGEPLLMGLDFFRTAVRIQQELGSEYRFDNSIQTNGTLLTDEVLDFCQEHDFSIGTSLDGPQWLHDFTRPYADGRSSFADILRAVSQMRERKGTQSQHSIGGGVIAILTKPVLPHLNEFYEFFRDNGINLKINPIFYAGRGATVRDKLGITPVEYGEAMVYLFNRWFNEPEHMIDIDPFDLILGNLMTGDPWGCQFGTACFDKFIAVDPVGNVHPCGRWSREEPFQLGNLNVQDMAAIRQSPVLEQFRQGRSQAALKCQDCEFHAICNSGCVENAYLIRQQLSDRDVYCGGYKRLFSHMREELSAQLNQAICADIETQDSPVIEIYDKPISLDLITPPALRQVIEHRLLQPQPTSWNDHKKWSQTYEKYQEHKQYERYSVYSDYHDWKLELPHLKYERHNQYSDHKEHRQTYKEKWNDSHSKYNDWKQYSDHSRHDQYYDYSAYSEMRMC